MHKFLSLLILVSVCSSAQEYDRNLYSNWIDLDGDCQKTRDEVLIAESIIPAKLSRDGCKVISGRWYDPFSGKVFTDPKKLDIDHFIPLKEVHLSGGDKWSPKLKELYSTDLTNPYTLIAVSYSENRSKGQRDPSKWMPSNEAFHCDYIKTWVHLKKHWQLSMDSEEKKKIKSYLRKCE